MCRQSCLACQSAARCGVGQYLDVETCSATHVAPVCRMCTAPFAPSALLSFTTDGNISQQGCAAICKMGMHTITNTSVISYMAGGESVSAALIRCLPCGLTDDVSCGGVCQQNQYRDLALADNEAGYCKPCVLSTGCLPGFYAVPCSGNETANAACLPCPRIAANRVYVDYAYQLQNDNLVTYGQCPSACANNFVLSSGGACVPCAPNCQNYAPVAGSRPSPHKCSCQQCRDAHLGRPCLRV